MRIALFGPPGAGKGTQAKLLVKRHGLAHISTGEIIRRAIRTDSPIAEEAKRYTRQGLLVPDEIVRDLAEMAIAECQFDRFVLDGYPRTVQQAEWLDAFLTQHETPLDAVLSFVVPVDEIVERLSKRRVHKLTGENYHLEFNPPPPDLDPDLVIQRADDRPEAIRSRIEEYQTKTRPVEEFYRARGILAEIDALGDFETIFARITQRLEQVV